MAQNCVQLNRGAVDHVFLCMLAYYVEWHMRRSLAPLLFHEEDPTGAAAGRDSAVAPAARSASTQTKTARKRSSTDFPVMGFRELLDCLGTITRNLVLPKLPGAEAFLVVTRPTPLQREALKLLKLRL